MTGKPQLPGHTVEYAVMRGRAHSGPLLPAASACRRGPSPHGGGPTPCPSLYIRAPQHPAQQLARPANLFDLYHRILGTAVYDLPAHLPEVWLRWDPKTVRNHGPEALLHPRMDFLLPLPHGQRIVLEADGSQHYTRDGANALTRPSTPRWRPPTATSLRGYDVFCFGHDELKDLTGGPGTPRGVRPAMFQRFDVSGYTG